jgi:hypothetical protein
MANTRPLVVSVEKLHRITQRREDTKVARYDLVVGSVSRLITRAVSIDPKRTSMFVSLGMLMGREMTAPGIDVALGIEYVCAVLRRNGFTATHIGEGILLLTWPPAPKSQKIREIEQCNRAAARMPEREAPLKTYVPAGSASHAAAAAAATASSSAASAPSLQDAQNTLSHIRRVVAKYNNSKV